MKNVLLVLKEELLSIFSYSKKDVCAIHVKMKKEFI